MAVVARRRVHFLPCGFGRLLLQENLVKYLLNIEMQDDLIVVCRLVNIFRRKGVRVLQLTMSLTPEGYALEAFVEAQESGVENFYHFLRRTEGVRRVAQRQPASAGSAEDGLMGLLPRPAES
jgi:acetolactate synthase regulatory subunit